MLSIPTSPAKTISGYNTQPKTYSSQTDFRQICEDGTRSSFCDFQRETIQSNRHHCSCRGLFGMFFAGFCLLCMFRF